jgi:hypothetical protein
LKLRKGGNFLSNLAFVFTLLFFHPESPFSLCVPSFHTSLTSLVTSLLGHLSSCVPSLRVVLFRKYFSNLSYFHGKLFFLLFKKLYENVLFSFKSLKRSGEIKCELNKEQVLLGGKQKQLLRLHLDTGAGEINCRGGRQHYLPGERSERYPIY